METAIAIPTMLTRSPSLDSDWRSAAFTGDEVENGVVVGGGFHPSPPLPPCVADAGESDPPLPEGVADAVAGDDPMPEPDMAETNDPETV